jgi:hypothetical protein
VASKFYRYVRRQPDTLASGRPLALGDRVPAGQIDPDDEHDANLLSDGALLPIDVDLSAATKAQLEERARDLNIEGRSNMNADELRAAIAKAEEEGDA